MNIISFAWERLQNINFGEKQSYTDLGNNSFDTQLLGFGIINLILSIDN